MTFSYFDGGIKNTVPQQSINLVQLVGFITNHPNTGLIDTIRSLREQNDKYYKTLKGYLPYVTPNCTVSERKLTGDLINTNLKSFSQYLYFDIDIDIEKNNVYDYKRYIIERYGHLLSMVCVSSSLGGVSLLFHVTNTITTENFDSMRGYIIDSILYDEVTDPNCSDIGRPMFLSYDTEVYVNYDNSITIDDSLLTNKKGVNQSILYFTTEQYRLNGTFSVIPMKQVFGKVVTKTVVNTTKPVVDVKGELFVEVTFPRNIKDGTKHKVYTQMIHTLVYLNPEIEPEYLYSYIRFINMNFGKPPMLDYKLTDLFQFVYNGIKNNPKYTYQHHRVKWIHFGTGTTMSGDEKRELSSKLNGVRRVNNTIQKIQDSKRFLMEKGLKVTQKSVSEHSGVSLTTVKRHFKKEPTDLELMVQDLNTTTTTGTTGIEFNRGNIIVGTIYQSNDYIHPDCPQWVINYFQTGNFV
jgi:hypothetical protein